VPAHTLSDKKEQSLSILKTSANRMILGATGKSLQDRESLERRDNTQSFGSPAAAAKQGSSAIKIEKLN